jgi:hypothetical protein
VEAKPPQGAEFPPDYRLRAVLPLYYGLLFFAEATAHQARLLPVTLETSANLKGWATQDPTTDSVRVAILNKDQEASGTVRLTVPGYTADTVKRMGAPSCSATTGITLGADVRRQPGRQAGRRRAAAECPALGRRHRRSDGRTGGRLPADVDEMTYRAEVNATAVLRQAHGHFGFSRRWLRNPVRQPEANGFGAMWVTQAPILLLREQGSGHLVQMSGIGGR